MDIRELAKEVIIDKGGIAKSADFVAAGMRAVDVVNMCNAGYLDRVRHGYYQLAAVFSQCWILWMPLFPMLSRTICRLHCSARKLLRKPVRICRIASTESNLLLNRQLKHATENLRCMQSIT